MSSIGLHGALRQPPRIEIDLDDIDYDEEGENETEDLVCDECGSDQWHYRGYGNYTQTVYFNRGDRYIEYGEIDTDGFDDSDGWVCGSGHSPNRRNQEILDAAD